MPSSRILRCLLAAAAATAYLALPPHPRLILTADRRATIRQFVLNDTVAAAFAGMAYSQAEALVKAPESAPRLGDPNARVVLQRLYSLMLADAASGAANATWRTRAVAEIVSAASAPEWDTNGTAQLNTGEMLHAAAFGLDWLYEDLSPAQRANVTRGIVETGLARVHAALLGTPPPAWAVAFVNTSSNWNTVILGGAVMGCLAVLGEPAAPPWVPALLEAALANLRAWSGGAWGPDGGWPEGPNYGGYASRYLVPAAYALRSATGGDGGLLTAAALAAPRAFLYTMSPRGAYFFYFDTRDVPETVGHYLGLAAAARDDAGAWAVKRFVLEAAAYIPADAQSNNVMNAPAALLYYTDAGGDSGAYESLPPAALLRGPSAATLRSSWTDPNATFIGFKGFTPAPGLWAHTHLDGGSFVLQSQRQWWAQDLGSDNYDAPGYFSPSRFKLYRTGVIGHNTLSFAGAASHCVPLSTYTDDCPPAPMRLWNASAPLAAGPAAGPVVDAYAVVNLTAGYLWVADGSLRRVERGFIVLGGRTQLVTVDEVDGLEGTAGGPPLWWALHTTARVALDADGLGATLTTANTTAAVRVRVLPASTLCAGASFAALPVALPTPQLPTPGVTRLTLAASAASCTRLVVAVGEGAPEDLAVAPLAQWAASGPLLA